MEETPAEHAEPRTKKFSWQWVVVAAVVGIIIFGVADSVVLSRHQNTALVAAKPSQTQQVQNGIYTMKPKGKLGSVVTDVKGMTLYTYAKDPTGASTCTGKCASAWPAYMAKSPTANLPAHITVIKRPDGTLQYAWKGKPLYYFAKDGDLGDAYGNGVGGVWSVIK